MKAFIDSPDNKRGVGFWAWKPYCILQALALCSVGDVIIYMDSGTMPSKDLAKFANKVRENGVFGFVSDHKAIKYTKRRVVEYFGQDYESWTSSEFGGLRRQRSAGFIGILNGNPLSMSLIDKWAEIMVPENRGLFYDTLGSDNHNEFIQSRHDQMIFDMCFSDIFTESPEPKFGVMYDAVTQFGLLYHRHYPGRRG